MPAAVALLALCAQGCMLDWDRVWDAGPIADLPGLDKRPDVKPDAPSDPNNWVVALGGQKSAGGAAVSLDTDDKVFATGSFLEKIKNSTNTLPTQGKQDLLMAKLSSDGVLQWTVSAGGVDQERSYDILVSSAGERFVSGYFTTPRIRHREIKFFSTDLRPDLPTLVVGDFNEDHGGRVVDHLKKRGLQSALEQFHPNRDTWRWRTSLGVLTHTLDHVLYSKELRPLNCQVLQAGRSDHLPVVAVFQ